MRSAVAAAIIFAAGSLAQPILEERDVVVATAVETVLKTVWVDVTGASPLPTATPSTFSVVHQKDVKKVTSAAPVPSSSVVVVSSPSVSVDPIVETSAPAPEPVPETSSSPAPASSPASGSLADVAVSGHNQVRSQHQASDVQWDDDLAESAQQLANTCQFEHNVSYGPASSYGQNIASSYGTAGMHDASTELSNVITDSWYTQEAATFAQLGLYGVSDPINNDFDAWGHFTQEVWKDTTHVGCAVASCSDWNGYFTVCNYGPAGNYAGQFAQNVAE